MNRFRQRQYELIHEREIRSSELAELIRNLSMITPEVRDYPKFSKPIKIESNKIDKLIMRINVIDFIIEYCEVHARKIEGVDGVINYRVRVKSKSIQTKRNRDYLEYVKQLSL